MPYTSPSDVPSFVPEDRKSQFLVLFNKRYKESYEESIKDGMSEEEAKKYAEASAFRLASGVTRKSADAEGDAPRAETEVREGTKLYDFMGDRISAEAADYMELGSAKKDGYCNIVNVEDGVSGKRGCCNYFDPKVGASKFNCKSCGHYSDSPDALKITVHLQS